MRLNHLLALAAAAASVLLAGNVSLAGSVERPVGVIELFTSQGCSSCPPADEVLAELADRGDLVALSYHVDYWDYLGWHDTLATPANTGRQYAYGRSFGGRSVYTPQAVLNGRQHMSGAEREGMLGAISRMAGAGEGMTIDVSAVYSGETIVIRLGDGAENQKAHVVLAYFEPESTVAISRGENSGRTIIYRNSVTSVQTVGMWHGKQERLEVPVAEMEQRGAGGCAILLQKVDKNGLPGPILGATLVSMVDS